MHPLGSVQGAGMLSKAEVQFLVNKQGTRNVEQNPIGRVTFYDVKKKVNIQRKIYFSMLITKQK